MSGAGSRAATAARALGAQLRGPAPPRPPVADLGACAAAVERAGARVARVRLDARRPPWTPAGLDARRGQPLTWLAHGSSWIASRRGLTLDAAFQLRARTGGAAPSLRGTGPTHTAPAPRDGAVELCSLVPAELHGPQERVVHDLVPRRLMGGGFDVVVALWPEGTDVRAALQTAAAHDPTGLCGQEAARLADPVAPPPGWTAHEHIPLAGLHRVCADGIGVRSEGRVEIICREAPVALTPDLGLRWRWRMDRLPSALAEDTLLTHDYLSVAVEFSDGRDLTYYWSSCLPVGTSYRGPLPHWRHRETHMVVRSGPDGLGTWKEEERRIAPDRDAAIGGPAPDRVERVWLIVTTVAQGGEARGAYADVRLVGSDDVIRVL
jgi:hypothetical protein